MQPADLAGLDPSSLALCLDFDGTLTEIVPAAADAAPVPGLAALLARLAGRVRTVAIISGRPVEFLRAAFPDLSGVRYLGLYGDAELVDGAVVLRPEVAGYRGAVHTARDELRADPVVARSGAAVEDKPLSVALHLRPIPAAERERWAQPLHAAVRAAAERHGLRAEEGRLVWELRPPTAGDKGAAVRRVVAESGARSLVVVGDDRGDLPAFSAAAALRAGGVTSVRVAVASDETPEELVRDADQVVRGPAGVARLLQTLLPD